MGLDLKIRSKNFALATIHFYRTLPKSADAQVLGKQLLRSATSVGANIRAAFRGRSKKEFYAKLGIVIEEADECIYWLELIIESGLNTGETAKSLHQESKELLLIFYSIYKKKNNEEPK